MQRECAMINPPPLHRRHDPSNSLRACVHCAATLSQTYPEALAVAAALDPRTRDSRGDGQIGGRTGWDGAAFLRIRTRPEIPGLWPKLRFGLLRTFHIHYCRIRDAAEDDD